MHTAREVGLIIKRHEQTVLRYRREGKLHGVLVGGGYLFAEEDVKALLSGGTAAPEPQAPKPSRHPKYSRSK